VLPKPLVYLETLGIEPAALLTASLAAPESSLKFSDTLDGTVSMVLDKMIEMVCTMFLRSRAMPAAMVGRMLFPLDTTPGSAPDVWLTALPVVFVSWLELMVPLVGMTFECSYTTGVLLAE
jgi:hypothetical protein